MNNMAFMSEYVTNSTSSVTGKLLIVDVFSVLFIFHIHCIESCQFNIDVMPLDITFKINTDVIQDISTQK